MTGATLAHPALNISCALADTRCQIDTLISVESTALSRRCQRMDRTSVLLEHTGRQRAVSWTKIKDLGNAQPTSLRSRCPALHMNGTGLNAKLRQEAEHDTGKFPLSHGTSSNVTRDKPKCVCCFQHQSGQAAQN